MHADAAKLTVTVPNKKIKEKTYSLQTLHRKKLKKKTGSCAHATEYPLVRQTSEREWAFRIYTKKKPHTSALVIVQRWEEKVPINLVNKTCSQKREKLAPYASR
jgi:hypothetical protein